MGFRFVPTHATEVSDAAVRKAIAAGRITPEADGTIDAERVDREWARNSDAPRSGTATRAVKVAVQESSGTTETGKTASLATSAAGGRPCLQARTVNEEVVKAQTNKGAPGPPLKGELVDRPQAIAHVFKLARSERDAWLNWPARISAQMAAARRRSARCTSRWRRRCVSTCRNWARCAEVD